MLCTQVFASSHIDGESCFKKIGEGVDPIAMMGFGVRRKKRIDTQLNRNPPSYYVDFSFDTTPLIDYGLHLIRLVQFNRFPAILSESHQCHCPSRAF